MQFLSVTDEKDFEDVLDNVQITPVKVISPRTKNNKEEKLMETTVGDLLLEAMSNLELSTKKGRLNQSVANSSTDTFKTPKMANKKTVRSLSVAKNFDNFESQVSSKLKMNDAGNKSAGKRNNQNIKDDFTKIEVPKEKKMPSRIVTSFSNKKIINPSNNDNKENEGLNTYTFKSPESKTEKLSLKTLKVEDNEDFVDVGVEVSNVKIHSTSKQHIENKTQEINSSTVKSSQSKTNEEKSLMSQKGGETNDEDALLAKEKKSLRSRIVTSFGFSKSNSSIKSDNAITNKTRPHVLTSQIRGHSLSKQKRNEPYISLAEAVSKFQKGTPKRFRSISAKPGPVTALKQVTLKITRPISPALTSKTRVRPVKALSHEQREKMELEKIRNRPLKANPVPQAALKKAESTKKIEKKPSTVPEPFHLSQSRKTCHFSSSESLTSKLPRQTSHSSTSSLYEALNLREPIQKKVVHAIVSSEDASLAVKEEELGHFGIPTEPCGKARKFTRPLPFSFEMRNKEFQDRKERKLKQIQSEDMKMKKMKEFHAKPAPSTSHISKEPGPMKGRMTPKQNPKESTAVKRTTVCPFSFEERNKLLIKKKENLIKETLEKDKKAREFHANPVPEFRPVIVRGRSRENIRMEEKTPEKQKIIKVSKVSKTHPTSNNLAKQNIGDQENDDPKSMNDQRSKSEADLDDAKSSSRNKISTVLSELNTDKRARERKDFHEKLKRKEMAEEELRRKEEEERLNREKAETAELRRMAEIKARPMPQYKPVSIIKSSKPLTDPQSPAWVRKSKM